MNDPKCNREVTQPSTSTAQNPSPTKADDDPGQGGIKSDELLNKQRFEEPSAVDAEDLDCNRDVFSSEVAQAMAMDDFPYDEIFSPDSFISTVLKDINEARTNPEMAHSSSSTAAASSSSSLAEECQGQNGLLKKRKLNQEVEGYDPQGDFLPSDAAFSIDHILEQILHYLPASPLLQCRLVCHRWLSVATIALHQTSLTIVFDQGVLKGRKRPWLRGREFSAMVELIEENLDLYPRKFPFTKFDFEGEDLTGDVFAKFLDVYGPNIRKLTFSHTHLPNSQETVELFRKLLTEETPNLEHLSLGIQIIKSPPDPFVVASPSSPDARVNTSLKILTDSSDLPLELLRFIMSICPRLEEVHTNRISVYLTPVLRLNLVKKFRMSMHQEILGASFEHPGTLKLKKLILNSYSSANPGFTLAFNHLLESSWDTLKSFSWYKVAFKEEMVWPEQMPNLTTIRMGRYGIHLPRYVGRDGFITLPPGFNLARMCPQLQTVKLYYVGYDRDNLVGFLKELNREGVPVLTVTDVHVKTSVYPSLRSILPEVPAEIFRLIETLFPSARYWGSNNCPLRIKS